MGRGGVEGRVPSLMTAAVDKQTDRTTLNDGFRRVSGEWDIWRGGSVLWNTNKRLALPRAPSRAATQQPRRRRRSYAAAPTQVLTVVTPPATSLLGRCVAEQIK